MSPKKFEQFSRALLTKMGVQFTDKGVKVSNMEVLMDMDTIRMMTILEQLVW